MNFQHPNSNSEDGQDAGAPGKRKELFDLGERTFEFAKRMLDIREKLPNKPECWNIRSQLSGTGTSVAANYEEGNSSWKLDVHWLLDVENSLEVGGWKFIGSWMLEVGC